MINGSLNLVVSQILNANGHLIKQVSNDFSWLTAILEVLLGVVKTSRDHFGVNVLCATGTNHLINTIFYNWKLTSVEHHANVRVREIKLLVSRSTPWEFRELTGFHITKEKGAVGSGDQEAILVDIDLLNFISLVGFEHDLLVVFDFFDNYLWKWHVGEFKFTFIAGFLKADIKEINRTT